MMDLETRNSPLTQRQTRAIDRLKARPATPEPEQPPQLTHEEQQQRDAIGTAYVLALAALGSLSLILFGYILRWVQ